MLFMTWKLKASPKTKMKGVPSCLQNEPNPWTWRSQINRHTAENQAVLYYSNESLKQKGSSLHLKLVNTSGSSDQNLGNYEKCAHSLCPARTHTNISKWEKSSFLLLPTCKLNFPEDDLLTTLVSLYFKHMNLHLPLFHRPRFEKSIADGLHRENTSFGLLVLLVCAVASRLLDDPRTLTHISEPQSAGWKWFNQAVSVHKAVLSPTSLYDLQFYPVCGT